MLKKLLRFVAVSGAAGLAAASLAAGADELTLRDDRPDTYTVVKGDTLWDISGRFLTQPWRWPELWRANPQIENPDLIFPGNVLVLKYADGKPYLEVADGQIPAAPGSREVKLLPEVRVFDRGDAVQAIPLDAVAQFLSRPVLTSEAEYDGAPYVMASVEEHLINGKGDRVYVRGPLDESIAKYSIYRIGPAYRDPDEGGRVIAFEALHVGDAVVEAYGDPATVRVLQVKREVLKGDRLFPQEEERLPNLVPRAPEQPVDGAIISVLDGTRKIGPLKTVVLSVGSADGVEPGHVLQIFRSGEVVQDPIGARQEARRLREEPLTFEQDTWLHQEVAKFYNGAVGLARNVNDTFGVTFAPPAVPVKLPDDRTGEVMVFRTFDEVSYGLTLDLRRPAHVLDRVRNPQ